MQGVRLFLCLCSAVLQNKIKIVHFFCDYTQNVEETLAEYTGELTSTIVPTS